MKGSVLLRLTKSFHSQYLYELAYLLLQAELIDKHYLALAICLLLVANIYIPPCIQPLSHK